MTTARIDAENRQQFRIALTQAESDGLVSEQEALALVSDADRAVRESGAPELEAEYYRDEFATAPFRGSALASEAERVFDEALAHLPAAPSGRDQWARERLARHLTHQTEQDLQLSEREVDGLVDDAREGLALADDPESLRRFYASELEGLGERGFEVDARAWETVSEFLRELSSNG